MYESVYTKFINMKLVYERIFFEGDFVILINSEEILVYYVDILNLDLYLMKRNKLVYMNVNFKVTNMKEITMFKYDVRRVNNPLGYVK